MISSMIEYKLFWLNALPVNISMSCTISTRTLMIGTTIDFNKHCEIKFGAYAEEHEKTFPQNSTQCCTEPDILCHC